MSRDNLLWAAWTRGAVHRTSDFVPAKLITYIDDAGRAIQASVWSEAPKGALWVVPLDRAVGRAFVKVRQLARRYVIDTRSDTDE